MFAARDPRPSHYSSRLLSIIPVVSGELPCSNFKIVLGPQFVGLVDGGRVLEEVQLGREALLAGQQQPRGELVARADTLEPYHGLVLLPQRLEHAGHPGHRAHLLAHAVLVILGVPLPLEAALLNVLGEPRRDVHDLILIRRERGAVRVPHFLGQLGQLAVVGVPVRRLQDEVQHLGHFLDDERHAPAEHAHKIRQVVGVWRTVKLQDVQGAIVEFENCSFIVVHVAIVGRRKDCNDRREARVRVCLVHLVTLQLRFVRTDHGQQ
mmetsp:Transcript_82317/g.214838  ORF Transcript_82317/g.214838 Transcript_82317/m.214838 type:complete len:265 (+) Transcript_82317:368-1162(+)